MKNLIAAVCILFTLQAIAQEPEKADSLKPVTTGELYMKDGKLKAKIETTNPDSTVSDTTRIELKNAYITIVNKTKTNDDWDEDEDGKHQLTWWTGIDLGVNGILGSNHDFNLGESADFLEPKYGQSRYIAFNFGQIRGRIVKDYVSFTTGFAFQIYNYKFGGGNEFVFAGDSLFSVPTTDEKDISKNKLRATYFAIPAMLEFNTSLDPKKTFHISAGVVGKIRIENMYKQKYEIDNNNNKTSIKGDLGFNRWAADAMVRVGYRRLTIFAQVGLLPMFDNDNTPDVYNFATGLFVKF